MMNRQSNAFRSWPVESDPLVDPRRLVVLVIGVMASIAAGVGAFIFLSATHPAPNRLSWSLEPPKSHKVDARILAAADLPTPGKPHRKHVRAL